MNNDKMSNTESTVKWGILATGNIARYFTSDLRKNGHTVTAVASRSEQSAHDFARQYDIPFYYSSYESMMENPDIDIVYIATPHPWHLPNALLALDHGKHVLIEKPITLNRIEAKTIQEKAHDRGLLALEGMWTRFLPHMQEIRKCLEDGMIGDPRALIADHTQLLSVDPKHRINSLELGGGALLDLGVYPLSLAWDIFGKPRSVEAKATFKETGADAEISVRLMHDGDRVSSTYSSSIASGPNEASIIGTNGYIKIASIWYMATGFTVFNSEHQVIKESRPSVSGRGMHYQAREAEKLILEGETESPVIPFRESVGIMGTLDEARRQIGLIYPTE